MELLALGASHKTADLAVRERLALLDGQIEPFLHELVALEGVTEAVALSTCNRTELYVVGESPEVAIQALPADVPLYSARNCDAARHLYRVVSGLDSMVVGEAEIQGQVKRAYERALAARTTGPLTNQLFRAALATGKRVRTETAISEGHASVATVAVDAARALIGELSQRHVVIVGAGETSEQVARAFHAHGVSTMFVANRHRDRAIALASRFGGESGGFDQLPDELERADVVVSSTASPHAIVGPEELDAVRGGRPLLIIDLAVPRDIDPACASVDGVTLLDMDALQRAVRGHLNVRKGEAVHAEAIVEEEIQTFAGWLGRLDVMPTLAALRGRGDAVVNELLAANAGRWESLSAKDEARVEALARAVVKRLLHEPTERVRTLDDEHRHARLKLLRELFGLEEDAASEAGEAAEVRRLAG
ncbi:glutamyl-tRNA reductase [Solirubrobacter deserti]|uniref:Glutamyl-tRNA reductase n=1 Tax=Solirubrobacter deserti TaxID=2282478 RepID=A0ABT4RBX8_9ACTN|nr:glutamyl-tRNA reductase [Solirubrobacter deserti]MDA0136031.1 glutamyl-tRNA reductase [Solirubrobacter deserti]